jgi:transposase-like protein
MERRNDITVSEVCKTVEVSSNSLYSLMGNKKPGEIFRSEKLKIVRKMRKEKVSEEEIAKAIGFF